jgi:transposase
MGDLHRQEGVDPRLPPLADDDTVRPCRPAIVLQDYIHAVRTPRRGSSVCCGQIEDLAQDWSQAPVVAALQAIRGVAFLVAVTLVAEVGDFLRFANPRQLMTYLGLVPSEHSSGRTVHRAGITKAGMLWRDAR